MLERTSSAAPVVSNKWYGDLVDAIQLPPPVGTELTAVRAGLAMFWAARRSPAIVTSEGTMRPTGLIALGLALVLARQRKLVLMEFLPGHKSGWQGKLVDRAYRVLLPRVCSAVQTMTPGEVEQYGETYGLTPDVIRCLPFYFVDDRVALDVVPPAQRRGLFSSGRNSCDWDTLLDAAEGQGWPLTIVCRGADAARIADRAAEAGVEVLSDLDRDDHDARLARARLALVVLQDTGASSGHVRLASAASRETPVIVSDIPGIAGYAELAVRTVPPGDHVALREAVNRALAAPEDLQVAEREVVAHAATRPFSRYAAEVVDFIRQASSPTGRRR